MRPPLPLALAAALALLGPPAAAQNLVTNPSFEVESPGNSLVPDGYTLTFNNGGAIAGRDAILARTGSFTFYFADVGPASATLAQTLPTTVGTSYFVSFFAFNDAGASASNLLTVTFGGVSVFSAPIVTGEYQQFTAVGVATGASTELAFTGFNTPGGTYLDDLSVTAVIPSVVPEPSTWALLASGLLGLAAVARRRRRAA